MSRGPGWCGPKADGKATLTLQLAGQKVSVPVSVLGLNTPVRADFMHDVAPVLSRLGCNQGTCHGSAQGKNGFKLSLRGYDPIWDVRALTDDQAARHINLASPDDSMMLQKPTGAVPHVGGALIQPGEPYYELIRSWIADGARLDLTTPRVTRIAVLPLNPVVTRIGSKQQLRVLATYASGEVRDVTREAFLDSANAEVALAGRDGLVTAIRRGEAPVLARFEGNYASTTLTVMGDRSGFVWSDPPTNGKIDELVAAKWKRLKILPSGLCSDTEFVRRVYLDLTGLAAHGRRGAHVPGRQAREPRQARRARRSPDRQPRLRRLLDQQVGRPAPGESQIPGRRRLARVSQLDSRSGRRQHALRPVRTRRS